ncbi:MAG: hypothetical protein KDA87_22520, partial [Planctomycetales bacterium]|nr:hypothetical protein [Planctomycetales bacterium]
QSHCDLIAKELNVKEVSFAKDAEQYISYQVVPNFKALGPRVGKLMPAVKKSLAQADGGKLLAELQANGAITLNVDGRELKLDNSDIEIRLEAKEGWAAAQGAGCVVVLSTDLTDELVREGYARDLVRFIQDRRKELNCEYTDRIEVTVVTSADELHVAVTENTDYIQEETLASSLSVAADAGEFQPQDLGDKADLEIGGHALQLAVRVLTGTSS